MNFYQEQAKQVPIKAHVDVLVVGSGPAGIGAALSAARNGAKTMIIEQQSCLGGIATAGLMSHWTGWVDNRLFDEILKKSAQKNPFPDYSPHTVIDPEQLKTLYLELLEEAGVHIQLYTFASGVIMEGQTLKGVITESKSGREAFLASVVVDATGDGDIAEKCGAAYTLGREGDGVMQPATIMFKVGGVDDSRAVYLSSFESTYQTEKGELQALARKHLESPAGHVLLYRSTLPGVVTCNMTNCTGIDGTKAEDLTKAEMVCRKQIEKIVQFLRAFVPGYENCFLLSAASLMGVRETRHFKGLYTLTKEDILRSAYFEDWVVKGAKFNFDIHNTVGSGLDANGAQKEFPDIDGYTIPYRCLVPEKIDGLLLAGRNISGTHVAHSNYRVMPICLAMGEGAGIAAMLCCQKHCQPRQIHAKEIQAFLA